MADRRLKVFHAVAKHLSFTKAADALFMTQPAVTFQIKQLEEYLNVRLFDRSSGGIRLTPAGVHAAQYAERILALSDEFEASMRDMGGQAAGPLLVGASMTIGEYVLPQIIGEFKARYPNIVPSLFVGNSEAVQERVEERTLDLGFIEGDSHRAALHSQVCGEDELWAVCGPSHPLAAERAVDPMALTKHPYIGREAGSGTRAVVDRYLQTVGVPADSLQLVVELGSPEAIKGLIATGFGFSIMSSAIVSKERELGRLVQIPLNPPLRRNFSMVYPRERFHPKLVGSFVQFACERMRGLTSR